MRSNRIFTFWSLQLAWFLLSQERGLPTGTKLVSRVEHKFNFIFIIKCIFYLVVKVDIQIIANQSSLYIFPHSFLNILRYSRRSNHFSLLLYNYIGHTSHVRLNTYLKPGGFVTSDPELWFAQLQYYFMRHNIKSEGIRHSDVCSVLHPSVAKEVRDLILSPQPYINLRRKIMDRLSLSDSQRIHRLFQVKTLGDRSPSQISRHLQVLMGDNTVDSNGSNGCRRNRSSFRLTGSCV
ncbi:unnamed protein product [Schistosoma intercalatum]|nr:unnamed protein product [Schistosoma intercalatum]CAH8613940.1 unnamed protein product [Schistosoma intercalatum]